MLESLRIETYEHPEIQGCIAQLQVLLTEGSIGMDQAESLYVALQTSPDKTIQEVRDLYDTLHTQKSPLYKVVTQHPRNNLVLNLIGAEDSMHGTGLHRFYQLHLREDFNYETLLKWRDSIDVYWRKLKEDVYEHGIQAYPELHRALGDNPSDEDFILYSIATFARNTKLNWHKVWSLLNSVRRAITMRALSFEDFGEKWDFCVDVSFVVYYLTASYKIYGVVEGGYGTAGVHHLWREQSEGGRMIDVHLCPHLNGFVKDPARYQEEVTIGFKWKRSDRETRRAIEKGEIR